MKTNFKLSLAAIFALATVTTLSAKPLSEAIENVEVNGSAAYRYNDYGSNGTINGGTHQNNWLFTLGLSSKINDDIKLNTRFKTGNSLGLSNTKEADRSFDIVLSEVNFSYTGVQNLNLTVGKQAIVSPWAISRDTIGEEATGTGINAVYNYKAFTFVGGFYNQTNFDSVFNDDLSVDAELDGSDFYLAGILANFGVVNADAYYANLEDEFTSYTLGVNASFDIGSLKLSPFARYTSLKPEENGNFQNNLILNPRLAAGEKGTQKLWQVGAFANISIFDAIFAYGASGSNGGFTFIDVSSTVNLDYNWRVTAFGSPDADYIYTGIGAQVLDNLHTGVYYTSADYRGGDESEVYLQAKYNFTNNLFTYVRLGQYDVSGRDKQDMGRLQIAYTF